VNSVIFNYVFSQIGLISDFRAGKDITTVNQDLTSTLLFSANKDILSSMDSEFITYLTSDILIRNNSLTFFSNVL
jgi:hypothetical protein